MSNNQQESQLDLENNEEEKMEDISKEKISNSNSRIQFTKEVKEVIDKVSKIIYI